MLKKLILKHQVRTLCELSLFLNVPRFDNLLINYMVWKIAIDIMGSALIGLHLKTLNLLLRLGTAH